MIPPFHGAPTNKSGDSEPAGVDCNISGLPQLIYIKCPPLNGHGWRQTTTRFGVGVGNHLSSLWTSQAIIPNEGFLLGILVGGGRPGKAGPGKSLQGGLVGC